MIGTALVLCRKVGRGCAKVLSGDAPQSNGLVTRLDVSLWYSAVRSRRVQACHGSVGRSKVWFRSGKVRRHYVLQS